MAKFRAWDSIRKEMITEKDTLMDMIPAVDFSGELWFYGIGDDDMNAGDPEGIFKLREAIGLKDKNGKEIFEGDYLEDERGFRYEVRRVQGGFATNTFADDFGKEKWAFWTATSDMQASGFIKESCVIIGNEFEGIIEENSNFKMGGNENI